MTSEEADLFIHATVTNARKLNGDDAAATIQLLVACVYFAYKCAATDLYALDQFCKDVSDTMKLMEKNQTVVREKLQ